MADSKITALTAISTVDPAADPLVIVDVSDTSMAASGTTKKITSNQILGAGGTATLASATITGAATVGTTLGVTGVSTFAAGTAALPALTTTGDTNTGIFYPAADTFAVTTGGSERYRVDSSGNVGIGVTPSVRLDLLVADAAEGARFRAASGWLRAHPYLSATDGARLQSTNGTNTGLINLTLEGFNLRFNTNAGNAMILDNLSNIILSPPTTPPTLGTNGQLTFTATSNTNLRFSYRGSDGTTRVANITLA